MNPLDAVSQEKIKTNTFTPNTAITSLLWIMAMGIIASWLSYFIGGSVHASDEVCYHVFERNFPAPDGMTALMCIFCAIGLRRGKGWSIFTGMTAVGGLLFLALIDISYNLWNGMYALKSAAMGAEIIINIVCIAVAVCLSRYLWKHRGVLILN